VQNRITNQLEYFAIFN